MLLLCESNLRDNRIGRLLFKRKKALKYSSDASRRANQSCHVRTHRADAVLRGASNGGRSGGGSGRGRDGNVASSATRGGGRGVDVWV